MYTGRPFSKAAWDKPMSLLSKALSKPWSCFCTQYWAASGRSSAAGLSNRERSMFCNFSLVLVTSLSTSSMSERPTISLTVLNPSWAIISLISSATMKKKLMTCSGSPANFSLSTGSWVAMPTGQVFLWHFRIIMQPRVMSGAVLKPNSSAPRRAAMATSLPVLSCPSVWRVVRPRRSLATKVWWVSAKPSSQGSPAFFIPVHLDAPVPPSWPEIKTWSACPLTTPLAIMPTPASDTNLTLIRAAGLAFFRSWINWARSSME